MAFEAREKIGGIWYDRRLLVYRSNTHKDSSPGYPPQQMQTLR